MGSSELLLVIVLGAVLLIGPIATLVIALIAYVRSRNIHALTIRVAELERCLSKASIASQSPVDSQTTIAPIPALVPDELQSHRKPAVYKKAAGWEVFIGQKAFGWLAVLLFVLSAAFFLRYAFQNNWIGPVGRVTISELVGIAFIGGGWWHRQRGLKRFSNMLTAAGIVVMYLATYSAFGFYQLLPQQRAGFFLGVLVLESMILAVLYRSAMVAMVAVIGGLLTPMLMASNIDDYSSFFLYLAILNAGVAVACALRGWTAVNWVAYLGTQGLFLLWFENNYHPDKFVWTLGFQGVLFSLYLVQSLSTSFCLRRPLSQFELILFVINAIVGFLIFRLLLDDQYRYWLGTLALAMATLYAFAARMALSQSIRDVRLSMTSIAVAVGFIASALPLQAQAGWVAFGWAAMGTALWWFGLRISTPLLRILAGLLAIAAVSRVLIFDLPLYIRDPFIPILNREALPSLGVAGCILLSVFLADAFLRRLDTIEQHLIALMGVVGVLLLWIVLSFECYGFFLSQSIGETDLSIELWRWRGQLALTVFWAAFATTILVFGFQLDRARLRWLAIAIYGAAVVKLFLVDMANVQQLYRILVFFVLAIVLGLVARAYQRFQ